MNRHLREAVMPCGHSMLYRVSQLSVVPVPVRPAAGELHVIAQQDHAGGAEQQRQTYGLEATVPALPNHAGESANPAARFRVDEVQPVHSGRFPVAGPEFEVTPNRAAVFVPPPAIHCEQDVREWSAEEAVVRDDYAPALLPRFAPAVDFLAVVFRETGAARDADDLCVLPAAGEGDALFATGAAILFAIGPSIFAKPFPISWAA